MDRRDKSGVCTVSPVDIIEEIEHHDAQHWGFWYKLQSIENDSNFVKNRPLITFSVNSDLRWTEE